MKVKFVLLLFFVTVCTNLLAQDNPFVGAWELAGIPSGARIKLQKFFDDKGEFFNIRALGDEVIKTHHGKYVIKSGKEYWEFIAEDVASFMAPLAGKTTHIYYKFSDDKKLLSLRADPMPGNPGWEETWRRIEMDQQSLSLPVSNESGIITGADQTEKYLSYLKGKRIGLVANQSSIIGKKSSVDSLVSLGVKIVKVFGPEHGFRGNASNGAVVSDEKDAKTGIPIISLYGKNEKPTKEQLADVDLMVFDIQDVGCRYYTNINTLEYVMEACAENNKELLILDRPNPNAYVVDGPVMTDDKFKSGIGIHYTPMTHGMTIGEFAQYLNGEGYLKEQCKIKIIKVANYDHGMPYILPINPSPNLNTQQAVMLFPSLCMFEGTAINEGRGTYMPFTILGAPALKGKYSFSYKPVGIPGMSERPNHKDAVCYGLDLRNYDISNLRKSRQINLSWVIELYKAYPDKANFFSQGRADTDVSAFDLRIGTDQLRKQIIAGVSEAEIRKSWEPGLQKFKAIRAKYLLYPD